MEGLGFFWWRTDHIPLTLRLDTLLSYGESKESHITAHAHLRELKEGLCFLFLIRFCLALIFNSPAANQSWWTALNKGTRNKGCQHVLLQVHNQAWMFAFCSCSLHAVANQLFWHLSLALGHACKYALYKWEHIHSLKSEVQERTIKFKIIKDDFAKYKVKQFGVIVPILSSKTL